MGTTSFLCFSVSMPPLATAGESFSLEQCGGPELRPRRLGARGGLRCVPSPRAQLVRVGPPPVQALVAVGSAAGLCCSPTVPSQRPRMTCSQPGATSATAWGTSPVTVPLLFRWRCHSHSDGPSHSFLGSRASASETTSSSARSPACIFYLCSGEGVARG